MCAALYVPIFVATAQPIKCPLWLARQSKTVTPVRVHAQANVNPTLPAKEWPLEALAAKLKQYCGLMSDLTPELLQSEAGGDYEALRAYLRRRGVEAYWKKARAVTPS